MMQAQRLRVAVIVPTFDEAANVRPLIEQVRAVLGETGWEIIFVDDDSPDCTAALVREIGQYDHQVRIVQRVGRRGLSSAVVEGMLATAAPMLAVMDGDLQHDEAALPAMIAKIDEGCDLAIGTPYAPGGSTGAWSESRKLMSTLATWMTELTLKTNVADPMSGYFVISRAAFEAAQPKLSGVGFKILMDLIAPSPKPLTIAEVPYTFRNRVAGESKLDAKVMQEFLVLLLDKLFGGYLPVRFLMFAFVGGLGLIVHLSILGGVLSVRPAGFQAAQAVAVISAMTFNFILNSSLTYRDVRLRGASFWRGMLTFYAVCSVGAVGNIGVGDLVYSYNRIWWVAGVAGALVGVVWNFSTSAVVTWKSK